MKTNEAVRPLKRVGQIIPSELKAIMEEAVILMLILVAATSGHKIAIALLGEEIPPVLLGLLQVSLWVMCGIYAIAVLSTMRKLVMGRLAESGESSTSIWRASTTGRGRNRSVVAQHRQVTGSRPPLVPVTVLVVDDDRLVSTAVKQMLQLDPRIAAVATANSPEGAIAKIDSGPEQEAPDVVLLDVNYSGLKKTGIDYLGDLHRVSPHSKLVVMSVCRDPAYVKSALAKDADGFIWKNETSVDFAEAVVAAAQNGFVASKSIAHEVFAAN